MPFCLSVVHLIPEPMYIFFFFSHLPENKWAFTLFRSQLLQFGRERLASKQSVRKKLFYNFKLDI